MLLSKLDGLLAFCLFAWGIGEWDGGGAGDVCAGSANRGV